MRSFYKVEAAGYWTVVNAASLSSATAKGLRTIARDKHLAKAEKIGALYTYTKIVKRNVGPADRPNLAEYEGGAA